MERDAILGVLLRHAEVQSLIEKRQITDYTDYRITQKQRIDFCAPNGAMPSNSWRSVRAAGVDSLGNNLAVHPSGAKQYLFVIRLII